MEKERVAATTTTTTNDDDKVQCLATNSIGSDQTFTSDINSNNNNTSTTSTSPSNSSLLPRQTSAKAWAQKPTTATALASFKSSSSICSSQL